MKQPPEYNCKKVKWPVKIRRHWLQTSLTWNNWPKTNWPKRVVPFCQCILHKSEFSNNFVFWISQHFNQSKLVISGLYSSSLQLYGNCCLGTVSDWFILQTKPFIFCRCLLEQLVKLVLVFSKQKVREHWYENHFGPASWILAVNPIWHGGWCPSPKCFWPLFKNA